MSAAHRRKIFLITGGACTAGFAAVLILVLTGSFSGIDSAVYGVIAPAINSASTFMMEKLSFLASVPFLCCAVLALLLLPKSRRKLGIPTCIAMVSCVAINQLVKFLVERKRPDILVLTTENGFSFPSGHSMGALVFYGLLIYFALRYLKKRNRRVLLCFACTAMILLIGISRIYLGVHFFSDVLGGFLLGGTILFVFLFFYERKLPV